MTSKKEREAGKKELKEIMFNNVRSASRLVKKINDNVFSHRTEKEAEKIYEKMGNDIDLEIWRITRNTDQSYDEFQEDFNKTRLMIVSIYLERMGYDQEYIDLVLNILGCLREKRDDTTEVLMREADDTIEVMKQSVLRNAIRMFDTIELMGEKYTATKEEEAKIKALTMEKLEAMASDVISSDPAIESMEELSDKALKIIKGYLDDVGYEDGFAKRIDKILKESRDRIIEAKNRVAEERKNEE